MPHSDCCFLGSLVFDLQADAVNLLAHGTGGSGTNCVDSTQPGRGLWCSLGNHACCWQASVARAVWITGICGLHSACAGKAL